MLIIHNRETHQFETLIEGHRAYLAYRDLGKQTLDFYRTFVSDELRGQGIAAALTKAALAFADTEGYNVIASCSYVEKYMQHHKTKEKTDKSNTVD